MSLHTHQAILYPDEKSLSAVKNKIAEMDGLITPGSIEALLTDLAAVTRGEAFLLQAGDCAERFSDCNPTNIQQQMAFLTALTQTTAATQQQPVVLVGRIAGQFAKPRSVDIECKGEVALPAYRGDIINGEAFTASDREHAPQRMLLAYAAQASALNTLPNNVYTSHEALLLPYEKALTRTHQQLRYNLSTHFPWIGMRTSCITSAHIVYASQIDNPIAIKIGPQVTPAWLQQLAHTLNPKKIPGRLTFIHRLGVHDIEKRLPQMIRAIQDTDIPVIWSCDPMHGNSTQTADGLKVRYLTDIDTEWQLANHIHRVNQSRLGGIHLEATHLPVEECLASTNHWPLSDAKRDFRSAVDPRLNATQAICLMEKPHQTTAYTSSTYK